MADNIETHSQVYLEFTSQQAATSFKHHIEGLNNGNPGPVFKRMTVAFSSPSSNPFRTLPKDAAARPAKDGAMQSRVPSGQGYQDRQGTNNMTGNVMGNYNQGGGYRGRGGYGGPRGGGMHAGTFNNRSYNNNMASFGNNMGGGGGYGMGGGAAGGFGGPGNFNPGPGGFRGGNMMGGGMRGGMRGGRGGMGSMGGMMGGMPMGGGMGPMGGMGAGMGAGMGGMNMMGMPGTLNCPHYSTSITSVSNANHNSNTGFQGMQPGFNPGFFGGAGGGNQMGGGGGNDWQNQQNPHGMKRPRAE